MSLLPPFVRRLVLPALALWSVLAVAAAYGPLLLSSGLIATHYEGREWQGVPLATGQEHVGAGDWLAAAGHPIGRRETSVSWRGWLVVGQPATFDIETRSDGPAWVYIDDRRVTDGYAPTADGARRQTVTLTSGLHALQVDLASASSLDVRWARAGNPLHDLGPTALYPTRVAYYLDQVIRPGLVLATALSLSQLVVLAGLAAGCLRRHLDATAATSDERRWVWGVLALAAGLQLWQVWYGLPASWELDELLAGDVLAPARAWFSGGWYALYPTLFYACLGVFSWPFMAAGTMGLIDLGLEPAGVAQVAVYRLAMVVCGVVSVGLAYRLCMEAFGSRRAAIWAGFLAATLPLLVYLTKFAKADVPYSAAFLAAALFHLRALRTPTPAVYGWFAFWGMVSICLKDQAYGLVVLPALHLVWLRWRAHGDAGLAARLGRLATDAPLWRAIAVAVAVFVVSHNLIFNFDGFVSHVKVMATGSSGFRTYESTARGQLAMVTDALAMVPWTFGTPTAIVIAGSLMLAWRARREALVVLLLPIVSYYLTFTLVIQYQYDRFYLAPAVLLAAVGGVGMAWLAASTALWARVSVAVAAVHVLLLGSSIDLLMARDSRFAAEAWLERQVDGGEIVGLAGPQAYLPRAGRLPVTNVEYDWAQVESAPPEFLVVNAEFASRARHIDFFGPLLGGSHPLYREAARFKSSPGLALLAYRPEFSDGVENPESNFDKINPEIRIYARRDVVVR
ncbi:MAG: glycosyltransferase family 39 protein [Vicinamibacterales bacterium]